MAAKKLTTPLTDEAVAGLKAGDAVLITGTIYTGRDLAHARLVETLDKGEKLPFDPKGAIIYYVGPSPAPPGKPIGSAGPTTSYRMDKFAPRLLAEGMKAMIGKGNRTKPVLDAIRQYRAVYLAAVGGAAALISRSIKAAKVIAYEELGPEAVRELTVEDFPAIVVNDIAGRDLYDEGVAQYRKEG